VLTITVNHPELRLTQVHPHKQYNASVNLHLLLWTNQRVATTSYAKYGFEFVARVFTLLLCTYEVYSFYKFKFRSTPKIPHVRRNYGGT
jgi:hypothetical protein